MIERTLVIGSTGFIGRAVVRLLDAEGRQVVGMRRWNSELGPLEEVGIPDIVANLYDRADLIHAFSGMNHVVYCAAPDPTASSDEYRGLATTAIRNVLEVARDADVERVVVTSTAATIAKRAGDGPADESDVYLPGSAGDHFVEAAYAVEQECFREAADGQSIVLLNPSIVLGPGARFPTRRSLQGTDDSAPVNWVDLGRVARAHLLALEAGRRGERYIVSGPNGTLAEFYAEVEARDDVELSSSWFGSRSAPYRNRYLLAEGQHLDGSKAERALGL